LSEVGKTPSELDDEDIEIVACIVAKVAAQLQKIKLDKQTPKEYALNISKLIVHKKTIPATFVGCSFNTLVPGRPYSSTEFQHEIEREVKTNKSNDPSDLLSDSYEDSNGYKISSRDMYKAIEALEKEIGLIHLTSKRKVKEIVKGKYNVRFGEGRPSFFMLPPDSVSLQKIMRNPNAIIIVVKSLKRMKLMNHMQFLSEAYYYLLRDHDDTQSRSLQQIVNMSRKIITDDPNDISGSNLREVTDSKWEESRRFMQSLDENQIRLIAKRTNELILQNPQLAKVILLLALNCN
jgi:hypothetical protein